MAFNPFHAFRKRQKTLLAAVAIMCMFLFILQFGKGDILERFGIGKQRSESLVVTSLYGKKVKASELFEVREKRNAAQTLVGAAFGVAMTRADAQLKGLLGDNPESKRFDPEVLKAQMAMQKQSREIQTNLFGLLLPLGTGTVDDLLDYLVWLHQADRLGIVITEVDAQNALRRATLDLADMTDVERRAELESGLRRRSSGGSTVYTGSYFQALADDLRVRLAQEALLGAEQDFSAMLMGGGESNSPKQSTSPVTPEEFWEFFKENRTVRDVALLKVDVNEFISQVKDSPTEREVESLYKRFSNVEATPESSKPGFKEPRRLRLEFVSARADEPFYRDLADKQVLAAVAAIPTNPLLATALAYHLDDQYRRECSRDSEWARSRYRLPGLNEAEFILPMFTTLNEPQNVASTLGVASALSPFATLAAFQAGPVVRHGKEMAPAIEREANRRLKAAGELAATAVGFTGTTFDLGAVAIWRQAGEKKQFLPLETVAPELMAQAKRQMAANAAVANLLRLKTDLEARRSKGEEVGKWLAESLKDYHVGRHVIMPKADSKYDLAADEALKPMREVWQRLNPNQPDTRGERFAAQFFDDTAKFVPHTLPSGSEFVWASEEEPFLYWKVDDVKPFVPSLAQARRQVEKAWRLLRARDLAREKAAQAVDQVKAAKGDLPRLRDLGAKEKWQLIELNAVARLITKPSSEALVARSYEDYKFPETVPYPVPVFLDDLVGLQEPGDTVVAPDQPESTFYVSTLLSKTVPTLGQFYDAYSKARSIAGRDTLLDRVMQKRRDRFREEMVAQIRSEAAPLAADQKYQVEPDIRRRFQARGGDEEG